MRTVARGAGIVSAWALAGLLVGLAVPQEPIPVRPTCTAPGEIEALDGHSTVVECSMGPPIWGTSRPSVRGPARLLFGLPLDLTTVDAPTLEALPGVGPVLASKIVRERDVRPFASLMELARVPGIGARRARRLAPWFGEGGE